MGVFLEFRHERMYSIDMKGLVGATSVGSYMDALYFRFYLSIPVSEWSCELFSRIRYVCTTADVRQNSFRTSVWLWPTLFFYRPTNQHNPLLFSPGMVTEERKSMETLLTAAATVHSNARSPKLSSYILEKGQKCWKEFFKCFHSQNYTLLPQQFQHLYSGTLLPLFYKNA